MKLQKALVFLLILSALHRTAFPQMGVGTTSPNASAGLDVSFPDKGFLAPRVDLATSLLVTASNSQGLMVYNTNPSFGNGVGYYYNTSSGTSPVWNKVGSAGGSGATSQVAFWSSPSLLSGDNGLFWNNSSKRLGIGTTSPNNTLQVNGLINFDNSDQGTYLGNNAGIMDPTGDYNVFVGAKTGWNTSSGYSNTAMGYQSFYSNTSGYNNTVTGDNALYNNSDGFANTAYGAGSLNSNVSGDYNTAVGLGAGALTTGNNNVLYGTRAGDNITSGSNNVILGYNIDAPVAIGNYQLSIGNLIYGTNLDGSGLSISIGNIGIGTSSPLQKLSVAGTIGILEGGTFPSYYTVFQGADQSTNVTYTLPSADGSSGQVLSTSGSGTLGWINSESPLAFSNGLTRTGNTVKWGGSLTESTTITQDAAESLTFTNAGTGNTTINLSSTGDLQVQDNGSPFFTATDGGLVGIGTTAPAQKLTVHDGNISLANTGSAGEMMLYEPGASGTNYTSLKAQAQAANVIYTLPAADGTSSQVLSTNGSGTLSWTANNAITGSGAATRLAFWDGASSLASNFNLNWDNSNSRLGIGTSTPGQKLSVEGSLGILEGGTSPSFHTIFQGGDQSTDLTYILPTSSGSSGQMLTTNGSGTLSWVNAESPLTFSNGLIRTSNTVKLGGDLTENTSINQNGTEVLTIANAGTGNTAINLASTGDFVIQDNASAFFTATDAGKIGIGTTAPSEQLEITGNLRLPATTSTTGILYIGPYYFAHKYGTGSTFVGQNSGNFNFTGTSNTGFGTNALGALTSGVYNTAIGASSLTVNSAGNYNTSAGTSSLEKNTTGNNNVGLGVYALRNNVNGSDNTGVGYNALNGITSGSGNIAIGSNTSTAATGTNNTVIGYNSFIASGQSNSIVIGAEGNNSGSNSIGIGNNVGISTDNTIKLGDNSITSLYCWGAYSSTTTEMPNLFVTGTTGQILRSTATVGDLVHDGTCTATRIAFWSGTRSLTSNVYLFWDNTNFRLGVHTSTPTQTLDVDGNIAFKNTGTIYIGTERFIHSLGTANTFMGRTSGNTSYTGSYNTGIGDQALYSLSTGTQNVGIGDNALFTTSTSGRNTAVGSLSLYSNNGDYNTAMGTSSLMDNSSGHANTAVGYSALSHNTTADHNTCVGYTALTQITTGSYNTSLGYNTGPTDGTAYNTTALGCDASPWLNNQVVIGNGYVDWIGGHVTWSTYSDGRFKKDLKHDIPGLSFIMKLNPVSYYWDCKNLEDFLHKRSANKERMDADKVAGVDQEDIRYSGFIAQEVEEAARSIQYDFSGVCSAKDQDGIYSLRYSEFVVPLVKAVQEQQQMIQKLIDENKELKERLEKLENK